MSQNIEQHVQKLWGLLEEEKLQEALDYIENLPQTVREHWEISNITGVISSYCGQFKEAVSFFRNALAINPDAAELYYNLADAYFYLHEYEHAELMLKCAEYNTDDESFLSAVAQLRVQIENMHTETPKVKEANRVLMVAYYFPPLSGSGVFRSIKFAKYLPDLKWDTTVISAKEPPNGWNYRDNSMMNEIPECVDVVRIPDIIGTSKEIVITKEELSPILNFLKNILQHDKEAMDIFISLLSFNVGLKQLLTFPCGCLKWAYDTVCYIEKNMDISKFDVIYTTSGPASSHLVGFYLKKKYGIPWVADWRDPWTDNPYSTFNPLNQNHKLLFCLEKILVQQADCNITVEKSWVSTYRKRFNLRSEQMTYITNGYDEKDFVTIPWNQEKTKKFTLSYSGLLYTEQRSVKPILTAVKELYEEGKVDLDKMAFRIVGQGGEEENLAIARQFGLESILEHTGYVAHAEAIKSNIDSDLLLLFVGDENKFKPVYTGKVFDYLRSGKPILALAPKNGAVDELLKNSGHGQAFLSTQIAEIKEMIFEEYQKWMNNEENVYVLSPVIKRFERKYLAMKLADVLFTVTRNR